MSRARRAPGSTSAHDLPKIEVMISSRAMTRVFGGESLSEVRKRLCADLHALRWYTPESPMPAGRDQAFFNVWIHEHQSGDRGDRDTLENSISQIRKADVILVLYTGEAGSADSDGEIGICHAELKEALDRRSEIVALVAIPPLEQPLLPRDRQFQNYVKRQGLFTPQDIPDYSSLRIKVIELLQKRVVDLASRGARAGGYKLDHGEALDWNRLDLDARRRRMRTSLARALEVHSAESHDDDRLCLAIINDDRIALRLDAIAAPLSNAAARERVGQPFLKDHAAVPQLESLDAPGVVHVIACHRGVSEAQALRVLGSPDAMAVASDFGVYALDRVQKVQILFLAKCSDESATFLAVRRLRDWLLSSDQQSKLIDTAASRRRILVAVAAEASRQ